MTAEVPDDGRRRTTRALSLHVLVEGEKVRRNARAVVEPDRLVLDDRALSFESVFWVSRRAGLLLLFGREFTAAVKGEGGDLDEVARAVERGSEQRVRRRRLLRPLAGEVVVCTAGTAVTGTLRGRAIRGFHVAVFTQGALHLLSRDRHHVLEWPVDAARRTRLREDRDDELLHLSKGRAEVTLRYLFPEEIRAVLRVADRGRPPEEVGTSAAAPPEVGTSAAAPMEDEEDGGGERALEMFARGQVAPPFPARLPEFTVSVDSLQEAATRAVRRLSPELPARASLPPHFFEVHFQELGEIALGPLLLRKSAASATLGLARAVEVMDAGSLRADTTAAVWTAVDRLLEVYASQLDVRLRRRGLPARLVPGTAIDEAERRRLADRMWGPVDGLGPHLEALERRQQALRARLEALESGPPEAEEEERRVRAAAAEWRTGLQRLDRAYAAAWRELLDVIGDAWTETLLPRLARVESLASPGVPPWVRWAVGALAALLLVALAAWLL